MAVNHTIKALSVECTAAGKMAVEGVFGKAPIVFKNGAKFCLNYKPKTSTTAKLEGRCLCAQAQRQGQSVLLGQSNPANKKATKEDIAAVEFIPIDLDPADGEASEAAKARYLKQLNGGFEPKPTAMIDSGNGLNGLARLKPRIELGEPVNGKFSTEDQAKIADVEARAAAMMRRLGAKAGTQNIDRILRLPGTVNLPTAAKRRKGRTECQSKLLWFNDTSYPLDAFPKEEASNPFGAFPEERPRDESGSGYGFRFMQECHAKGMSYDKARAAILLDETEAGVWARRVDERQLERAFKNSKPAPGTTGVTLADFRAYLPDHNYIFMPTGGFWKKEGINALQPGSTRWLDRNRPVHALTWAPGHPMLIENRLVVDNGWIERNGVTTFNFYRPSTLELGDPTKAEPWLELVHKVYPDDAERLITYLAHRVQRPGEKINNAVLLGGTPGIGKDTIVEPVKRAVGAGNCRETSPTQIMGRFNGFYKAVILRVSEVRDLGEFNRYQFYERMKAYLATPPDTIRVDEKNIPEHEIVNCFFAILTSNQLTNGIYLPPDDRRHDVMWSKLTKDDFKDGYWNWIWGWYDAGGISHVAAYLTARDISKFNPKAPPPKTAAFWAIVDANRAPEDSELTDVLDKMGNPDVVTVAQTIMAAGAAGSGHFGIADWLCDRKNRRAIPHRFEGAGYTAVRNDVANDGLWVIGGRRQVIYAKKDLSLRDQINAAAVLQRKGG
jgi:hypothetical protein